MSKSVKQTRTTPASMRAAEQIRQLIFNGELIADSNHLESELASRLGISRTPVREATLMLQARGLLEVQPRKGVRINAMSAQDLDEVFIIITEMECLALRQAAKASYKKNDLNQLDQYIHAIDDAINKNDLLAWAAAEEQFHVQLVVLGQSEHILSIVDKLHDQIRRARNVTLKMLQMPVESDDHYRQVYDALLACDAKEADRIHRHNRNRARKNLIDTLQQTGLKRV